MKQYVFTVETNDCKRELIFNANGIVDAVNQLKLIMDVMRNEGEFQMKSVYYNGVMFKN
ncbi:hypothetical protein [uncultured Metabacillus sp.]|uniref:hypothetical protein n=1 Tax=uncultured Metabacillus sp. TaxID=2860135 RepID=UPI00262C51B9|nr:hypothetical protein [uncultured Metabacillus sp.]